MKGMREVRCDDLKIRTFKIGNENDFLKVYDFFLLKCDRKLTLVMLTFRQN